MLFVTRGFILNIYFIFIIEIMLLLFSKTCFILRRPRTSLLHLHSVQWGEKNTESQLWTLHLMKTLLIHSAYSYKGQWSFEFMMIYCLV